ncbi:hypothetical protein [Sphingobacterium cellulitidis]|uniref:hypothetical protein n=1 Tax=Sphingobacterium cellulitidis TaxID=1768011 RepID=UPI0011408390
MKSLSVAIEKEIENQTIQHLSKILNRAIELVRTKMLNKSYQDHTGNLNSSTGFIIYKDGKVVHKDFRESAIGTDKATGLKEGLNVALSVLRGSKGWGVVFASGMEYASWVESRGFEVLRGTQGNIDVLLKEAFEEFETIE